MYGELAWGLMRLRGPWGSSVRRMVRRMLQPKWKRETQGYTLAPDYPQIILSATTPADGPRQYWLISSATGANTRSFLAVRAVA
ncbi:MAG: hypothetical protein ACRDNO_32355, partial [Trebonia sp.]